VFGTQVRRICLACCVLAWIAIVPLGAATLSRPYTVENYDVSVRVDLANQRLYGEVSIRLHGLADTPISALELDAGGLEVGSVTEGQASQPFERDRSKLVVVLTNPLRPDEPRTVTVRYQAGPAPGLKFFPDQIYTAGDGEWMPCNDRPGERATLHMTITVPIDPKVDIKTAASGQMTATRTAEGQSITEWRLDSPAEPSWFGFALGSFTENTSDAEGVKLRVLGAGTETGADKQILEPTAAAMHYLAERTGKHYPAMTYTQVFAHGDAVRSMAGLTLLPESYAQGLAKPENLRLLASELAHQWYGVAIAVQDWSDLWLSDGVSAFLADGFLGQRLGKESYEREIQRSRQIFNQRHAEGKDRQLSGAEWTMRQEADGEIPEHKGAWFLYLANQLVGDNVFWNGLRLYTSDQWGHTASSEDLQKAFDAVNTGNRSAAKNGDGASGRKNKKSSAKNAGTPLDNLFDLWVYGIPNTTSR
jgi:aminopeptidase N